MARSRPRADTNTAPGPRRAGQGATPALGCVVALMAVVGAASCGSPSASHAPPPTGQAVEPPALQVIQHEEPRRDYVGPQPSRFRWSPIAGADRYAIGLWNETDRLMWRHDDLATPTVPWPDALVLDPGTYFWSVSALENGREIAKSGSAAFVLEP